MSETKTKRSSWAIWMHIAGVAYAAALWLIVLGFIFIGMSQGFLVLGAVAVTVATLAFIGGWGRYMATKG